MPGYDLQYHDRKRSEQEPTLIGDMSLRVGALAPALRGTVLKVNGCRFCRDDASARRDFSFDLGSLESR
jgi:hypothetical protein